MFGLDICHNYHREARQALELPGLPNRSEILAFLHLKIFLEIN